MHYNGPALSCETKWGLEGGDATSGSGESMHSCAALFCVRAGGGGVGVPGGGW